MGLKVAPASAHPEKVAGVTTPISGFAHVFICDNVLYHIYNGGMLTPPQAMEEVLRTAVYITVGKTNRNPVALADLARRQANYLGPQGFRAMRDQTDESFEERGYHRLVFSSGELAARFQERVEENCDPAVSTEARRIKPKVKKLKSPKR